jgi:DNA segregation ATPase FtsK/SpoIIIE, S-DNA-T family
VAARKKKAKAKSTSRSSKNTKRKKSTRPHQHVGFFAEGGRMVMSWLGALAVGIGSALAWAGRHFWDALHGRRGRQPFGMALAAISIFALVGQLTYAAGDPGSNWCGSIGHYVADLLLRFWGVGAFLVPAFGAFWGIARLLRENEGGNPLLKLIGVLVFATTVSLVARGVEGPVISTTAFPAGPGGWIGARYYPNMREALGQFGMVTLLVLMGGLSSLFATEWAFVPLIRELARRGRESLRQQDLPLQPQRNSLREEAQQNHQAATRQLKGFWARVTRIWAPFHPPGEQASGAPKNSPMQSIPSMEASSEASSGFTIPTPAVEPEAAPASAEPALVVAAEPPVAKKSIAQIAAAAKKVLSTVGSGGSDTALEVQPENGPDAGSMAGASLPGISSAPAEQTQALAFEAEAKPVKKKRKPWLDSLPPAHILEPGEVVDTSKAQSEIDSLGRRLQDVFDAFGLDANVVGAERGPTLTLFEVKLAAGVSVKKLNNQRDDLGVALGSHGVRIVYPLPGRTTVGIEVPNLRRDPVRLKEVYEGADLSWEKNRLPMVLGRDTLGKPAVEDLAKMPHMLVAGTTGSGKSVCLNSILVTMLLQRTPDQIRMVLIDPKQVELQLYQDIPHLLCPVVTDMKRAPFTLDWAVRAMEDRLHQFKMAGVRNINDYNALGPIELARRIGDEYDGEEFPDTIPFIVLVIDELADLMMVSKKEVEVAISRLAAKARAAGIHLLVATQRPSTDVVTGLIKMNLPVRMAFRVTSLVDSRVILDEGGAEALLGNGDFLYRPPGASGLTRGQGAFVSESEVREICDHLRANGKPEFLEDLVQMKGATAGGGEVDDPLYVDAVRIILQSGRGSASLLQRALSIGYTRASRLIDIMTEQGVLGPFVGSKAREVMLSLEEWEAQHPDL